jgi:rod shape-determining protein MreC
MPTAPRNNRTRIILIALIIICLVLVTLYVRESDSGPLHKIQGFFLDIISPISTGFSKLFRPIKDGFVNLFHLPTLSREKADLQREVADLRREKIESRELENDVKEVKELLNWSEANPDFEVVGADIIAQSPDNWQRLMIVNAGSNRGIKKYMAVVTEEGLVGRVISVGSRSSVVQLITDSSSGVGARDQRSRETGIVEGRNTDTLKFVPMNDEADFKVGDVVETSGLGGTCPQGIVTGKITKVEKRGEGLARLVEVESLVRFSQLKNVLVIITPEPESGILKEVR